MKWRNPFRRRWALIVPEGVFGMAFEWRFWTLRRARAAKQTLYLASSELTSTIRLERLP